MRSSNSIKTVQKRPSELAVKISKYKFMYLLLFPAVVLVLMFNYAPLWGVRIAFQEYNIYEPSESLFVGLKNFKEILTIPDYAKGVINTLTVSILNLVISFPLTIIFALLLNEIRCSAFKRTTQTISYLPHFLSWISVVGMVTALYAKNGLINDIFVAITGNPERQFFLAKQSLFLPNVVILSTWKSLGWGSIVFLAAIAGVDHSLIEAAKLDGAGRLKQVIHVILPTIVPTIIIMLLWRIGSIFDDNFELIYGLQNTYIDFEVIQTLIFKQGIEGGNYGITTAFGLMQGLVNFILLFIVNTLTTKTADTGLF